MKIKGYLGELSGKLDGFVASRNKGGAYLRAHATPTNPQTTAQTLVRNRLGGLAKYWAANLTEAQRGGWSVLAEAYPQPDGQGGTQQLSGIAMFQKVNGVRLAAGDAILADAPADLEVDSFLTVTLAAPVAGTSTVDISVTDALAGTDKLIVKGAINKSVGINNVNSELRLFDVSSAGEVNPVSVAIPARFGTLTSGTKCFFSVSRYNDINGAQSPPVLVSATVA